METREQLLVSVQGHRTEDVVVADVGDSVRFLQREEIQVECNGEHQRLVGELGEAREGENEVARADGAAPLVLLRVTALPARHVAQGVVEHDPLALLAGEEVVLGEPIGESDLTDLGTQQRHVDRAGLGRENGHVAARAVGLEQTHIAHDDEPVLSRVDEEHYFHGELLASSPC